MSRAAFVRQPEPAAAAFTVGKQANARLACCIRRLRLQRMNGGSRSSVTGGGATAVAATSAPRLSGEVLKWPKAAAASHRGRSGSSAGRTRFGVRVRGGRTAVHFAWLAYARRRLQDCVASRDIHGTAAKTLMIPLILPAMARRRRLTSNHRQSPWHARAGGARGAGARRVHTR